MTLEIRGVKQYYVARRVNNTCRAKADCTILLLCRSTFHKTLFSTSRLSCGNNIITLDSYLCTP